MALLEVKNLKKNFGSTEVLKDINFDLEEGQAISIIGSSGSGKTTLLRCLNFLEIADGGTIIVGGKQLFDGSDVRTKSDKEIRANRTHFGMVFQQFNLFPQYTALENVTLAPILHAKESGQSTDSIIEMGKEILKQMGLEDRMDNYPHQLSGGQQQRVAIARAVVTNARLLLADEPTGNLDSTNGVEVMELLSTLNKQGTTIIIVTHSQRDAAYAHRIIRLLDGKIIAENRNRPMESDSKIEIL